MISKITAEGKAFWKVAAEVKKKMQTWPPWKRKHIIDIDRHKVEI